MKVLLWHVHGSWTTAFVQGPDEYLLPVDATRSPDGRGRATSWTWPENVHEVPVEALASTDIDVVVLQRPHELELTHRWTRRRPGTDLPAVYVEHNAPPGPAAGSVHPLAERTDIRLVHVTHFNALMWDNGRAPTTVVEHGVPDPGPQATGEHPWLAAVVNEPVRRWRVAGTDVLLRVAARVPVHLHGIDAGQLDAHAAGTSLTTYESTPQHQLFAELAGARAYLHPYRWTSLGLALVEAMTIGMPVLVVASTEAPTAVPPDAGVVSADPDELVRVARRWLADPQEAREVGRQARAHALARFGLERFVSDWQLLLKEVVR